MASTRFPRSARVRASADFDRMFKHGRRVALPVLAVHWQPQPELGGAVSGVAEPAAPRSGAAPPCARLGLAVSRKVDPHAVGRNRIKRVLRDCFRHHRADLLAGDYVVVARVGAANLGNTELRCAFLALLQRAGALPGPAPPGTMPAAASPSCAAAFPPTDPASAPRVGGA